jgi:hypothetical protein
MTHPDDDDGNVVHLPTVPPSEWGGAMRDRFEHVLDDEDDAADALDNPQPVHPPGGYQLPRIRAERAPVLPSWLRDPEALKVELADRWDQFLYEFQFHGIRSPWYLAKTGGYALWGLAVAADRLRRWWWLSEATGARLLAALEHDGREYRTQHLHQRKVRAERGAIIGVTAVFTLLPLLVITLLVPWLWLGIAPLATALLARAGRPAGKRIITASMAQHATRVISEDTLVRAYAVGSLCKPGTEGQGLGLGVMARERNGTTVDVMLPHGKTFADVLTALPKIASGLDVKESQIVLTESEVSGRRHRIWIADEDPLGIPAGRSPLLDLKRRNVWRDLFPMGLDQFGRVVAYSLLWVSFLIGAQPRKGKTFTARHLALFCALDPHVRITIADGKASPDWRAFRYVAHQAIFGTRPTREGDPRQRLLEALTGVVKHIEDVNEFLSTLTTTECPYGKVTEELCRKYPKRVFMWLVVMEEFQEYVEGDDQDLNKKIAGLLATIRALGPSVGVILISSTQKPAGIGSGDVLRLMARYRDNHDVRIALKCGSKTVSEAVLGGDSLAEGDDATKLPRGKRFKGICIFRDHPDFETSLTVRGYLADGEDAEVIVLAGRRYREQAGTLSGEAAGEDLTVPARDVLADVLDMFRDGEAGLHWRVLAKRLDDEVPERWADVTHGAISAQCRALEVPSVPVKMAGESDRGCRRADILAAMGRERAAVLPPIR